MEKGNTHSLLLGYLYDLFTLNEQVLEENNQLGQK